MATEGRQPPNPDLLQHTWPGLVKTPCDGGSVRRVPVPP